MRWLSVFLTVPLWAQPAQLSFSGATSTQIVISYQAPDNNACTVVAVNQDDPSVAVYDLDFNTFPGAPAADSDLRHDWNVGRRDRIVVIGRRTSEPGPDGRMYSRALEADAAHRITVTCTGGSAALDARTSRLPIGDLFPENAPSNASGFGHWAWPSIDWGNRNHPVIDPMTGLKIKMATMPGDYANRNQALFGSNMWVDWSGGQWANPQNAASGNMTSLSTYSGTGNQALFLGVDPVLAMQNRMKGGWGGPTWSVDDIGIHVAGFGSSANAADRTLSVCLSIDSGQSCYTNALTVVLPQSVAADTGVQPSNFPSPMFAGWGKPVWRAQLPTSGTADIAGNIMSQTGSPSGATFFAPELATGSKIRVNGSNPTCANDLCTVQSVQDATHLVLAESLNLTGAAYTLANFGVRVVKTTGAGSVSLSLRYENAWSFSASMPPGGATEMCSHIPVQVYVDASGQPLPNGKVLTGYNCVVSGMWYWISTDTGESRLISLTVPPPTSAFSSWDARDIPMPAQAAPGVGAFDVQQGNVAYTFARLNIGTARSLFKLTYQGDYRAFSYQYPTGNGGEQPNAVLDNVAWTNLSPVSQGKDLQSQIRSGFPAYDESRFGPVTDFYGISGDYAMFLRTLGGQDTPCWVFLYNLKSQTLEHGFNSWDGSYDPLFRWGACHSGGPGSAPNTATLAFKPAYVNSPIFPFGGPYATTVTAVLRNGAFDTSNTAVPADPDGSYDATCPAGLPGQFAPLSGTTQCLTVRVAGEACSAAASANEKLWYPCPWDNNKSMLQTMAVGDSIMNPDIGFDRERMTIVKKTVIDTTSIELVLRRNSSMGCGTLAFQRVNANGWRIAMAASGTWTCEAGFAIVDPLNRIVYAEHRSLLSGHFDYGVGSIPGTYSFVGIGFLNGKLGYVVRDSKPLSAVGQGADFMIDMQPQFAHVDSTPTTSFLQMYASKRQWNAPQAETRWALDFRHMNGSFGIPFESDFTSLAANTAVLQPGTSHVYKVSILGAVNVKKVPLLGFAGKYLLKEKSSAAQGNTLTDTDSYYFCYAYAAGECRQGSAAGEAFVSLPAATITGSCQAAQYSRNIPCLMTPHPWAGWALQVDATKPDSVGAGVRRLTMGLDGPGRQYAYGNLRALPDGKWALMSGSWIEGLRIDVLLVKIPSFIQTDSANRGDFIPVRVSVGARPGAVRAIADFGYAEYGSPSNFYCTARAEACHAVSAAINPASPFLYTSEVSQGGACSSGCTLEIPALPARVLFYRVRMLDANGATVETLPMQILSSPEDGR